MGGGDAGGKPSLALRVHGEPPVVELFGSGRGGLSLDSVRQLSTSEPITGVGGTSFDGVHRLGAPEPISGGGGGKKKERAPKPGTGLFAEGKRPLALNPEP